MDTNSMRLAKPMLARVAPFALYIAIMASSGFLADAGLDIRWIYAVRVGGTALLLWYFSGDYHELTWSKKLDINHVLIAVFAGLLVFVLWISLNQDWMMFGKSAGYDPRMANGELNHWMVIIRLAGAALVVPVMEELFWRSFIMRWLDAADFIQVSPINVTVRALFISSLVFAIEHTFWLAGLVAGLVYGLLYIRTQNLWVAIIAHAVTNAMLGLWVLYTGRWNYW